MVLMEKINFTVKDVKGANFGINDVAIKKVYPPLVDETVIPTKEQQVLTHEGEYGYDTVTVEPIPDEYIIPEGTLPITENTIYDVTKFKRVSANVKPAPELQDKEATPTKETQNVTFDTGFDGLHTVTIKPIPDNYIEPTGTKEIKTEGTHDVTEYASVNVDVEPTLQDKQVTITENGTQNITADEGFDGLGNVEITTNAIEDLDEELNTYATELETQEVTIDDILDSLSNKVAGGGEPVVEPDYITDGLIAWWEGEDGFDENIQWHSRVGDDYITSDQPKLHSGSVGSSLAENPPICADGAVFNMGIYGFYTQRDYCVQDYTIQVVGRFEGNDTPNYSGMGILIGFNVSASPMIGINDKNSIQFSNGSNLVQGMTYNVLKKNFSASINLENAPPRGGASALKHLGSVNGSDWVTSTASNVTHTSKGNNMTVLCYYTDSYKSCGARIYSIRVYNRKLTHEELQYNYKIDKARFDIVEEA